MSLKTVLTELGLTTVDLVAPTKLSRTAMSRLVKQGLWPAKRTVRIRLQVIAFLKDAGATDLHWALLRESGLFPDEELPAVATGPVHTATAAPAAVTAVQPAQDALQMQPDEDAMLLENTALTPEAKRHFKLPRSPFVDDVATRADVFASPGTRYVRTALLDCAMNHGFIAIIGESGSGKTTLREDLEERIRDEDLPVIVIKPYVLAMEPNDVKGKMMKSGQIAEAIARTLAPSLQLHSNPETCLRQVHDLLRDSCRAGRRHLLVIEEAHRMPLSTLKHLKGWMELKDGLRRLMGVCLIGQPELAGQLGEHSSEIREIVQRCEKVSLGPLGDQLEAYVRHKLDRVGVAADDVLEVDAYDAIRARLTYIPRDGKPRDAHSICYPLAVNNLLARAMVAAVRNGWAKVDKQVVMGC